MNRNQFIELIQFNGLKQSLYSSTYKACLKSSNEQEAWRATSATV